MGGDSLNVGLPGVNDRWQCGPSSAIFNDDPLLVLDLYIHVLTVRTMFSRGSTRRSDSKTS